MIKHAKGYVDTCCDDVGHSDPTLYEQVSQARRNVRFLKAQIKRAQQQKRELARLKVRADKLQAKLGCEVQRLY